MQDSEQMELPLEPGLVSDPNLGVPDDEVVLDDDGEEFETEINDEEDEEDDDS